MHRPRSSRYHQYLDLLRPRLARPPTAAVARPRPRQALNPRSSPLRQRGHYLLRRVLTDVVPGALERHRPVVGERRLPPLALARAECLVACRPHDQRRAVVERGEPALDLAEPRRLADDG